MKSKNKDRFTPKERSRIMAMVKSTNTKPEIKVRSILHQAGFRFRKNVAKLPGSPDIVLPKYKTVIFVHGCFWHKHDCKRGNRIPSNRREYWEKKLNKNAMRDKIHQQELRTLGWDVIVIWECELKKQSPKIQNVIQYLKQKIDS